jgi:hypothetical protein
MKRIVIVLGLALAVTLTASAADKTTIKDDIKSLQGTWVPSVKGDKKIEVTFRDDEINLFVSGKGISSASGTTKYEIKEIRGERVIRVTFMFEVFDIKYKVDEKTLKLDGEIRILGLGKQELKGTWDREMKKLQ